MPNPDNRLDSLLEQASVVSTDTSSVAANANAKRKPVPPGLRARILKNVAKASSELLAQRLRHAGEQNGWNADDLAEEARGQADEARRFLRTGGDPSALLPRAFARLFWRAQMSPPEWQELLLQTIAAYTVFRPPMQGEIWGRTHGLSGRHRADALGGVPAGERDPERAEKAARGFVEEVVEEWTTLMKNKTKETNQDDD